LRLPRVNTMISSTEQFCRLTNIASTCPEGKRKMCGIQ
jgi:hypothetical protein